MAKTTSINLRNQVIYQVFPRQYSKTHDLKGVTNDLKRIKDLGVDYIQLLPIHPIGVVARKGKIGSPYSIKDYRKINPDYGTMEDFKELLDKAHELGLKVIMDIVFNHTSRDSVLSIEHPEWFYHKPNGEFSNRVGDWSDITDFKFEYPELEKYLSDTLLQYVRMGVDGFRFDVASLIPYSFFAYTFPLLRKENPDIFLLAETIHFSFGKYLRDMGYDAISDPELYTLFDAEYEYDVNGYNGYFDTSDGVKYIKGANSFYLDVDKSVDTLKNVFNEGFDIKDSITLEGEVIPFNNNESYESINTLTSSYSTVFTPNTYLRNINLNTALSYINGTVVEPGGIFSYCDTAGPFNKQGYVFYYEFVGNGVCQIATTTYNAALRGGLEIVKRYPHAKRSAYVPGGLDATVASYGSGWCVDMQFKNTYEYPIYIKAYSYGGVAYVEFWSNSEAKHGRTYEATSVRIGNIGYRSYLHTYENGEEIDVHEIETTWYKEE